MSTTSTDPIADMLTRIRNAVMVRQAVVTLPHSAIKQSIAELLAANGYLGAVRVEAEGSRKNITITVMNPETNSSITEIKRLSTPGRRLYVGAKEMPVIKQGRGIVIVSTSKGLMTGAQAKAQGMGGELLCSVY
jgi:small subunit ribosomal protein S8